MEKLIKENILYAIALVLLLIFGVVFSIKQASNAVESWKEVVTQKKNLVEKQQKLEVIRKEKEEEELKKQQGIQKETESGKVIYEMLGQQVSAEASFGILIEDILGRIADAGIAIRSIDYNFSLADDKIILANVPGYNACELSFLAVGKYPQYQTLFKNLAKDKYLSGITEVYIEPYDNDKTILIARFKIRLYTKTI